MNTQCNIKKGIGTKIIDWCAPIYATTLTALCIYATIELIVSQAIPVIDTIFIIDVVGGSVCGLLWSLTYELFHEKSITVLESCE
jgi:hypothetical protein